MKAMILAAGTGTRLLPLTLHKPKALVEINGVPLIKMCINKLQEAGIHEMVINLHHFGGQIIEYLVKNDYFGADITFSDESHELLDSGGGIFQALPFFGREDFLVYNVDVISDIDLNSFYTFHKESGAMASLAVRKRNSSRYLLGDEHMHLRGWQHAGNAQTRIQNGYTLDGLQSLAFSGIHMIKPELLENSGLSGRFSIIDLYLREAEHEKIMLYPHDSDYWFDLGKFEELTEIEQQLKKLSL